MNIFYVHTDPVIAAQSLVDKHCIKMILESAQLLSTAHRVMDGQKEIITPEFDPYRPDALRRKKTFYTLPDDREYALYLATHVNHPSAIWCRESVENYLWLVEHFHALLDEYTYRYGKKHKCYNLLLILQSPPFNLKEYDMTPMPCAMDDEYKISDDPVVNYRNYYNKGKASLHKWTKRDAPDWIIAP
jgi:hypothetical protein